MNKIVVPAVAVIAAILIAIAFVLVISLTIGGITVNQRLVYQTQEGDVDFIGLNVTETIFTTADPQGNTVLLTVKLRTPIFGAPPATLTVIVDGIPVGTVTADGGLPLRDDSRTFYLLKVFQIDLEVTKTSSEEYIVNYQIGVS